MTNETAQNDTCITRRSVLSGASALALATAALRMRSVLAEDGTPVATPAEAPSWLFTQTFTGGDWEPTEDPAKFALHLRGGLASTVGFTDRPNRDFTVTPTGDLLPILWSDPANPPNAAIIVEDAGTQYTFLIVLTDPVYDEAGDVVTYTVSVLNAYEGDGLGAAVERVADGTLPQSFGSGAIFIDSLQTSCGPATYACTNGSGQKVGTVSFDQCFKWSSLQCMPCNDYWWNMDNVGSECNNVYPDACAGTCYVDTSGM